MATITHTLVKYEAKTWQLVSADKLIVGDVVATKGNAECPQRLRRVDIVGTEGSKLAFIVSTPRTGADVEAMTCTPKAKVLVVGRVEPITKTAKPKTAKAKAPTKSVTKVDAIAQTTPETAKPSPRPKQVRQEQPTQVSFADKLAAKLSDRLGAKLDALVESALDSALDAAIARVLA